MSCFQFDSPLSPSRRSWLQTTGCGFGALAFQAFAQQIASAAQGPYSFPTLHHTPKAKRVIFLFMHGGVSQVDSFDPKPQLKKYHGKDVPIPSPPGLEAAKKGQNGKVMDSHWAFRQHGQSGAWISDLWPHLQQHADDLCFIKSMHTRGTSHGQAVSMIHTGNDNLPRPSVGSWISYGLGAANENLPAFVSVTPPAGHGGARNYGASFLPAHHQATALGHSQSKANDVKIAYLQRAAQNSTSTEQLRQLDLLRQLNGQHLAQTQDSQVEGVIQSYELAYRMQGIAPDLLDISAETEATQQMYGLDQKETKEFGRRCLLARRFCEAGVRYIQVSTPYVWDQHGGLVKGHTKNALSVDKPIAGLLADLKQRGLMEDTLVVWGTEFGRTPIAQGKDGRDHNPVGFTVWLSGAGVKPGYSHGATDEFGYYAQQDKVHMHDLHATILHLLGIDHERLTYRYAGRDFRLTDVYGEVVQDILA